MKFNSITGCNQNYTLYTILDGIDIIYRPEKVNERRGLWRFLDCNGEVTLLVNVWFKIFGVPRG